MRYHINEGHFEVSDGRLDRTVNVLMPPNGSALAIVVSRDTVQSEETLSAFVDRQLKQLTSQVSQFKELGRRETVLGNAAQQLKGFELVTQFKQNGQALFQRQAIFLLSNSANVLILTASSAATFDAAEVASWERALSSFVLRST